MLPSTFVALLLGSVASTQAPPQFVLEAPAALFQGFVKTSTADVDGDGDLDVFVSAFFLPLHTLCLLRNDGAFGFTDVSATQLPAGLQGQILTPFDCDGDGDLDVFWSGSPSTLAGPGAGDFDRMGLDAARGPSFAFVDCSMQELLDTPDSAMSVVNCRITEMEQGKRWDGDYRRRDLNTLFPDWQRRLQRR